ncbi:MAG: CHAT domain-containing protein, partial [Xanthomonadales bacterium]|nr:CHAT domain-containing protein [Xanthomonadales bacterium]
LGHYSEAVDYYERALRISEQLGSLPAQSQDHGNLGYAYTGLGAFDEATSHFRTALDLAERSGMVLEQGYWLRGLANAQIRSGRPDQGLVNHRAALDIYRNAAAEGLLLEGLHDLGRLMLELGDPVSAEQYFQQAMELARSLDHARGITQNLVALGDLQFRHGRLDEAEALYRQAQQRAEASGEQALHIVSLLRLAALAMERGQYDAARSAAQRADEIAQAINSLPGQAEARLALAGERLASTEFADALVTYHELEATLVELGDPDLAWQADYGRGLALIGLDRKAEAVAALQNAVERIESVRSRLQEKRFRTGYLQDKHQVYIELVRLQLDLGQNDAALTTAERLRTLSFNEQGDGITGQDGAAGETAAFALRERIRQLQQALGVERAQPESMQRQAAIDHFSRELLLAEQQYQAWLDDAARSARTPSPPQVAERVGQAHKRLAAGEALIEYVVAEETVMIFVLRPNGLHVVTEPASRDDLRSRIGLLRDLIAQRDETRWTKPAARLAADLLDPVAEAGWLDGVQRLYLVPHGVLNYLPFAVLPASVSSVANTLVDRYTLAYLPTALALPGAGGAPTADWSLLGVAPASSRLRHAPAEASSIVRLFEPHSRILDGTAATETLFRRIAPDYRVLHLATHGYFNKFNPLLSGLEMEADETSDGRLEVHEILRLRLRSDLVTLSACDTGLGSGYFTEIPAGDDFVGMTRAFLQAGSAAVLASLWEVDDRSTVDLMTSFYGELKHDAVQGDKA